MKSWLRNLVNSFSRKPQAAAQTSWHAEDFQPAPERPAVADPWAPETVPTALHERPTPAPDPAPAEPREPAAPAYSDVPAAPAGIAPAAEGTRYPQRDAPGYGLPLFQQDKPKGQHLPSADAAKTRAGPVPTQLAFRWKADQPSATEAASPAPVPADAPDLPSQVGHSGDVAPDKHPPSSVDLATSRSDHRDGGPSTEVGPPAPCANTVVPVLSGVVRPPIAIEADRGRKVPVAVTEPNDGGRLKPGEPHDTRTPPTDGDDMVAGEPPQWGTASASPAGDLEDEKPPPLEIPFTAPETPGDDVSSPGDNSPQPAAEAIFEWGDVASTPADPIISQPGEQEPPAAPAVFTDWDDFAPVAPPPPPTAFAAPRDDDFELPEYDPRLSQRLGDANWAATKPHDALARQRAGMIAALLEVTSRHEAQAALQWLEDFFQEHRWAATFRAIESAALEGLDFPTLRAMAELKEIWAERPDWWLRRVFSTRGNAGGTPTQQMPSGATALSWRLARRICLARCDYPPDEMIDCEWLAEWYDLPSHAPGAQFFTAFLQEKAETMLAEALHEGLAAKAREYEPFIEAPQRLAPRRPLRCGAEEDMISPEMVDLTVQRQRKVEDDS